MAITSTTEYNAKDLTTLATAIQAAISAKTCATVFYTVFVDQDGTYRALVSIDT